MVEKNLKDYFYHNRGMFSLLIIGNIGVALSMVMWSFFMKTLADVGENRDMREILKLMVLGIIFLCFYFWINKYSNYIRRNLLRRINYGLKTDIFKAILEKDINTFHQTNSGKYISILNNDIKSIEDKYFRNIPKIINSGITCVIATAALFLYNPYIAIVTIIVSAIPMIIPKICGDMVAEKQKRYLGFLETYNLKIKDIFHGFEVIKSFNVDREAKKLYKDITWDVEDSLVDYRGAQNGSIIKKKTLCYGASVVQLLFSIYLVMLGEITFGILLGTMQVANYVAGPLDDMAESMLGLKSIKHVREKVEGILNHKIEDKGNNRMRQPVHEPTPISIKGLNYGYDETCLVLKDINFHFEKDKKYALVGNNGAGKSTLIKLIMGYFENYEGEIRIGSEDVRNLDKVELNENISMIHQKIIMFNDTLKNNITMFQEYPAEYINRAVRDAGLEEVVASLEDGLESSVNESGNNYSGGEQQRISIARSFLRQSDVMLMDEATSNLDNKTSLQIEDLILNRDNLTAIVVTHKLVESILRRYDCIVAMNHGRIEEYGSFDELIAKEGYFYSLYKVNA